MKNDTVITSRVRLARNYSDLPFLPKMTEQQAKTVLQRVRDALLSLEGSAFGGFDFYTMADLSRVQKQALMEKHLISPDMVRYGENSGVALSRDGSVSVLVNEEDHIRIQALKDGYDLKGAYDLASQVDDILEAAHAFAFDEEFGYLTICPTNVGTGLRASAMLHLPALSMARQAEPLLNAASKLGIAARGLYGEGSEATGQFYQVSNQVTLGITEQQAIQKLSTIVDQIVQKEAEVTNLLKENVTVQDRILRSYGILKYARLLPTEEYMRLLSDVRLGLTMGLIHGVDGEKLKQLTFSLQPANLMQSEGGELPAQKRDQLRAERIRSELFGEQKEIS